jgi:Zn-finger nucleic acid-binding protein
MECPVCKNVTLVMSERQGVEINYCPNCRGVWLDREALDKIIDKSESASQPMAQPVRNDPRQEQQYRFQGLDSAQQSDGDAQQQSYQNKRKRESFLGELFDFDWDD